MDVKDLIGDCRHAARGDNPMTDVGEIVASFVRQRGVAGQLGPSDRTTARALHRDPELLVLHLVLPPGAPTGPHDHRMWVATGVYQGLEHNQLFVQTDRDGIEPTEQFELGPGDVRVLDAQTIHSVHGASDDYIAAVHVYGGDLMATPRSAWGPDGVERPYDDNATNALINVANMRELALGRGMTRDEVAALVPEPSASR